MEIVVYICLFAVFYFLEKGYILYANKIGIEDNPEERSSHQFITVRGGGFLFYIAVLGYVCYFGFPQLFFFIGLTIISLVSFVDDVHSLSPKTRLVCQLVALALMVCQISTSSVGIMLSLIVLSAATVNIVNFMDGINGMLCGMSLVVLGTLQYVNYNVVFFIDPHLIWCVIVADLAFCSFNFKGNADCFAGDVGSMAMGFILFYFIIRLIWVSNDVKWFVFLGVFLADGGLTIVHRIFLRENILLPHRKHAYEIMANELKIPHLKVSLLYMLIQMAICVFYILVPTMGSFIAIIVFLVGAYLVFMMKNYHLHQETLARKKVIALDLTGKTVLVIGEKAKKNVALHVKDMAQVKIVELDHWDEAAIEKYKPTMVLFE